MDNTMDSEQKSEMQAISAVCLQGARRSEWDSVFSSVKAQVPSLDSDTSVSDGEDGDVFIFQRDEANLIPDLSDEMMDILSDDPEMQDIFGSTQHPKKGLEGVRESSADPTQRGAALSEPDTSHDPLREILLSSMMDGTLRQPEMELADIPRAHGDGEHHSGRDTQPKVPDSLEETGKLNSSHGVLSKPTEICTPQVKEAWPQNPCAFGNPERSHYLPFQHVRGSTSSVPKKQSILAAKPHQGLSLQSLQCIEQWDLDTILQNLEEQGDSVAHTERNALHGAYSGSLPLRSEAWVMEQLELLCARQSQATSYSRAAVAGTQCAPPKLSNPRKDQNGNSDVCPSPSSNSAAEHVIWKCPAQPPTIYIDLRNAQPQESEPLPEELPEEEKEQSMGYTGKSLLLKQLRSCRKVDDLPSKLPPVPAPQEAETRKDPESLEEAGMPRIRRKRRPKVRGEGSEAASPRHPVRSEAETGSPPDPEAGSTVGSVQKEAEKDPSSAGAHLDVPHLILPADEVREYSRAEAKQAERAQREDELKEKHRRQRLQQQLETLKPRHSITGKQPMAEKTPVLFHMEASYLPDISMLPTAIAMKQEMLLMTIWLSSCGHVASAGLPGGRTLETAVLATNIYHALVTWLISLVPAIKVRVAGIGSGSSDAPFQVVGLQQTWREDGLALYACLVPLPESLPLDSPKTRRLKAKEDLRGMSTFYQKTSKYLSHTWLQSITWWREALTDHLQDQIYPVLPEVPAIRLSSITTINPDPEVLEKAFASPRGFYWQTVETDEKISSTGMDLEDVADTETEVAMALLFETLLSDPLAFHHMLQLILSSGLDICGLRLLYPLPSILLSSTENMPSSYTARSGKTLLPVLAIALRGPQACNTWQDISGPCDPQLARLTDSHSLNALYCQSRAEPLFYSPHTEGRILQELCVWFGGRVPSDGVVHVGIQNPANKSRPRSQSPSDLDQEESYLKGMVLSRPPATLICTSKGDIFLAVSPAVPPSAYGDVISTCTQRGFTLQGIRRLRISAKRASMLSMSASQIAVFCPSKPLYPLDGRPCPDDPAVEPHLHTLLLLLRKENAGHHVLALIKGLMNEMAEQGLLAEIRSSFPPGTELQPSLCFHVAHYTDNLLQGLGGSLSTVAECGSISLDMLSLRTFASNPELEQVVIFTLTGKDTMKGAGALLRQILRPTCRKPHQHPEKGDLLSGFELLGLKWLPRLSRSQAKEVTPFEVGDRPWQQSIDQLMSSPALVCALRRINAFVVLAEMLKTLASPVGRLGGSQGSLQRVMSSTSEMAFRQAALFFTDKDFVSDARNRPALKYIPPQIRGYRTGEEARRGVSESIFSYMLSGPQLLCTVLLLKPGAWARSLPKILRKLNLEKFCVVAMKSIKLYPDSALELLPPEVKQDPTQLHDHCNYLTSDLSLVLCLQRQNAVRKLLDLLGPDDPNHAQAQDQFLWRAQYGTSPVKNGFYGSTSYQTAVQDMKRFFPEGLCCAQSPVLEEEKIFNVRSDPLVSLEFSRQRSVVRRKLTQQLGSSDSAAPFSLGPLRIQVLQWHHDYPVVGHRGEQGVPFQSALCQTTCLVLPESLLEGCNHPPYIPLLEHLVCREFVLTGARLTRLDQPQAHLIAELLSPVDAISATRSMLIDSSCLVLAAQRDNAVSCFHSLIDSADCQKQVVRDCMQLLLYPKTEKQADELLCCFFDCLTQDSIHQIAWQDSWQGP